MGINVTLMQSMQHFRRAVSDTARRSAGPGGQVAVSDDVDLMVDGDRQTSGRASVGPL